MDYYLVSAAVLFVVLFGAILAYIVIGSRQNRKRTGYQWKPEQDYDVIQEGESSMTPAFPKLKKREDK
ncbi:MAG: hypothetical protein AAGF28_07190 [Pseudomonadota bacterium]